MKMPTRNPPARDLPGVLGTARVGRRAQALLPRLRPGDVAVLDQHDLDGATARALVRAGVAAVVNASPMLSGRYPSLGAEVLAEAGVVLVDRVVPEHEGALRDGVPVRLHAGDVLAEGGARLATGRVVELATVREEMTDARTGLAAQLESFTRNSVEFLRREEDLLLHGRGLPVLATSFTGRSAVVVVRGHGHEAELDAVRPFLREQHAVVVAVGRAAEDLHARGHRVDVVVVDGTDDTDLPRAEILKAATDVVVRVERHRTDVTDSLERLGVRPLRLASSASTEDAALLLAHAGDAELVVGVGMHATLEEFLDRQRPGLASTYLTRLVLGPRLVDAAAVPLLYSGRVRPHHLVLVLLAGLTALLVAVLVTPVGQDWFDQSLGQPLDTLRDHLEGLLG